MNRFARRRIYPFERRIVRDDPGTWVAAKAAAWVGAGKAAGERCWSCRCHNRCPGSRKAPKATVAVGHKGAPGAGGGGAGGAELPAEVAELPAEGAGSSSLQKPKPAWAPVRVGWARKKTSAEVGSAQLASSAQLAQLTSSPWSAGNSGRSTRNLGPIGQHREALSSYTLQRARQLE